MAHCRDHLTRLAAAPVDDHTFRVRTMALLRRVVGFDAWCWSTVDPLSGFPTDGLADHSALAGAQRQLFELIYAPGGADDVAQPIHGAPVSRLHATTRGAPVTSRRWAELLGPRGVGDELCCRIRLRGECWGNVVLYRGSDSRPFSAADAATLMPLLQLWARRHRAEVQAHLTGQRNGEGGSAGSAVLLLDGHRRLVASSAEASSMLATLPQRPDGEPPLCVTALAAWLAVRREDHATPHVPVHGSDGWLLVQAHRLRGGVTPGTVAVTLTSALPAQLAPMAMAAAGLTAREREITALVLAGMSTAGIAATLHIAGYTVQDHLRHVFTKFGLRERRQLVARLLLDPSGEAPPILG